MKLAGKCITSYRFDCVLCSIVHIGVCRRSIHMQASQSKRPRKLMTTAKTLIFNTRYRVTLGFFLETAPPLAYLFPQNNFTHIWHLASSLSRMRMELAVKYIILIVCLVLVHDAACTHFRGGTFTYKPVNPSDPANTTVSSFANANKQPSVERQRLLRSRYQFK